MTINDAPGMSSCKGTAFCLVSYAGAAAGCGDLHLRVLTRRTPYMALCTRSEVYIRLVCPGIGLAGRGDDAPSRRRPYVSQPHGVGSSKFAFESHMSGSHLACQECGCWLVSLQAASPRDNPISGPAEGSLELNLALPQRNSDSWASCYRQTRPKTSICGTQQQTPTTTANLSNFLLQGSARSPA